MSVVRAGVIAVVLAAPALIRAATLIEAASCATLLSLSLPETTITLAQDVPAGDFSVRAVGAASDQRFTNLPAFCRVAATLKPSSDSDIKVEVWMPASNWNGKFLAAGNGGYAGTISYSAMAEALRRGYATSSTDTGHTSPGGSFALGHPEKMIDFGYRSPHEMTVKAKAIINAFYGKGPRLSYWSGCSTGGRQGLKEAERFPNDYNGIISGDAANPKAHLNSAQVWIAQVVHKDPASYIPPEKYPMIHQAVVGACDAIDGLKDGLIDDPRRCHFDPKILACKGEDSPSCLTVPQVEAARKIMSPVRNPRTGAEIYPGLEPGTELGWGALAGPEPTPTQLDHFKYMVFNDPKWDWRTFNFDSDVAFAEKADHGIIDAIDPNLKAFAQHGKLLMYHGWSDQLVAPQASINYYKNVVAATRGTAKASNWFRLFMAPGMSHCRGGEGPNTFDMVTALEQWVEKGKAPDQILASHIVDGKVDRTRPLCPYPQVARYKGSGSIDDAVNFVCTMR